MVYAENVTKIVEIIDKILQENFQEKLFDNPIFMVDQELNFEDYIQVRLSSNSLDLLFIVAFNGLDIYIDRANEIYSFSRRRLQFDRERIEHIIRIVLTSTMRIEYFGRCKTVIHVLDASGKDVALLRYYSGFYFFQRMSSQRVVGPAIVNKREA